MANQPQEPVWVTGWKRADHEAERHADTLEGLQRGAQEALFNATKDGFYGDRRRLADQTVRKAATDAYVNTLMTPLRGAATQLPFFSGIGEAAMVSGAYGIDNLAMVSEFMGQAGKDWTRQSMEKWLGENTRFNQAIRIGEGVAARQLEGVSAKDLTAHLGVKGMDLARLDKSLAAKHDLMSTGSVYSSNFTNGDRIPAVVLEKKPYAIQTSN